MGLLLKSISFCDQGDKAKGSLYCRKDALNSIDPVAYLDNNTIESIGVFVSSALANTISVTIEVENTGSKSINAMVKATEISTPNLLGNIEFSGNVFPPHKTVVVHGSINTVYMKSCTEGMRFFEHKWKWQYTENGMRTYDMLESKEDIYTLARLPIGFWNTNPETYSPYKVEYIWTSLLDICCEVCNKYKMIHSSYPKTDEEYISMFTEELNENPAFKYDTTHGERYYNNCYDGFKLQKFIRDRSAYLKNKLNCSDCASIVQIECMACGIKALNTVMSGLMRGYQYFETNPIIAIGCTSWAVPFPTTSGTGGFSYHEVSTLDTTFNKDTRIWDACLKLDEGPFPSQMIPPSSAAKIERLPLKKTFAETASKVVNVPPKKAYTKQFYRERLVADTWQCELDKNAYEMKYIDMSLALRNKIVLPDSTYIESVKKQHGLEKNPLPKGTDKYSLEERQNIFSLPVFQQYSLLEDYGRNKIYGWQEDDAEFQLELIIAYDEEEAYHLLVRKLSGIANPHVKKVVMGDIAYRIGHTLYLFVKNNVLVKVTNETEGSQISAAGIAQAVCDLL